MSRKNILKNLISVIFFIFAGVVLIKFISKAPSTSAILLVGIVGFGTTIMIHEFGHFIACKICGITVEAFSIGFPPTMIGFQKTEKGIRFRIFPTLLVSTNKETGESQGGLVFTVKRKCKPSDTEWRIGLIPFGGFVKPLGQEDVGVGEKSDDPKSFANKPISSRMTVIASGVIFNIIGAFIILTSLAYVGMDRVPAVVGAVTPGFPAQKAGIVPGDEILAMDGKEIIDFEDLMIASAISSKNKHILKIRHLDGSEELVSLGTEIIPGTTLRGVGIEPAQSLRIAEVKNPGDLYERLGLEIGDEVFAVNGQQITGAWEINPIVKNTYASNILISAKRFDHETGETIFIDATLPLQLSMATDFGLEEESDLAHICSMVPRLRITNVSSENIGLELGDIIVKISDVDYPTFYELREVTAKHDDKEMAITVIRKNENGASETLDLIVTPKTPSGGDRALIGIAVTLDANSAIVAKTISTETVEALDIPRGSIITAVNGHKVTSFYDIMRIVKTGSADRIKFDYSVSTKNGTDAGSAVLDIEAGKKYITAESGISELTPFGNLKRTYKADSLSRAMALTTHEVKKLILRTYATLNGLIRGRISPKHLMGPVGILDISHTIISQKEFSYYIYLLGMINCMLAVFNFLPIPIVDGGAFILLIIEKIKGSPVNVQIQQGIVYVGVALLGTLAIYVTFNDVVRVFFSP